MIANYIVWDVNPYILTFPDGFPLLGGRPIAWYGLLWAMVFIVGIISCAKCTEKRNSAMNFWTSSPSTC